MPPTERIRTTKACVACSIRKIKCDGQNPCAHCIRFFDGECFFTSSRKRGPPKGCPARGGHKKRQLNEAAAKAAAEAAQGGSSSSSAGPVQNGSSSVATGPTPPAPTGNTGQPTRSPSELALPQAQAQAPSLLSQVTIAIDGTPTSPLVVPPSTSATLSDALDESILTGFSFSPSEPIDSWSTATTGHGGGNVFNEQRVLHDLAQFPPSSSGPALGILSPSFAGRAGLTDDGINDLILIYETFIHQHWPMIYVPALRSLRSLETPQPLLFDAMLAISAANAPETSVTSPQELGFASGTGRAMSEVCDALTESVRQRIMSSMNSREDISCLQVVQSLIMIALVDQGSGRTALAYQMGGFACRMAVNIGLHTNFPSDYSKPRDGRYVQERYRTLWSCFILDKMLAAVSQRPPSLRLVDIDIPRPSTMERDELDLWLSGSASHRFLRPHACEAMESVKAHALSNFNSWCDVMAILELILSQVYRPSTRRARMEGRYVEGYEETVVHLDSELRKWRESLPPELQWSDDDDRAHVNVGLHLLTCRGWYNICLLLLHRPQVPYLDTADSPDIGRADSYTTHHHQSPHPSYRLPNGADASRHAATAVCKIMGSYENTFRISKKFASSWVYLVFQAATVHAGLAAHSPRGPSASLDLSPVRAESVRLLEQCIHWLEQIAVQWSSAGRHVEILRKLAAVGARTRPPSPAPPGTNEIVELAGGYGGGDLDSAAAGQQGGAAPFDQDPALSAAMNEIPLDANGWMLLWASMPTAGDDFSLWQQCFPDV